jgi:hypothetical protein
MTTNYMFSNKNQNKLKFKKKIDLDEGWKQMQER